ncbi:MAG: TetR family transcriptional regulator [Gammaproteobacteria bacterium]|nr:TetR family transcriptional regulator [Gammaproteobacteria bacterium]MBI5616317.1 TetR family transcriptional regulator [Gammaproteobacteria bacterium]
MTRSAEQPRTRRQVQAETTAARVLAAAAELFAGRPYDAVSMAAIADAAGCAHGLPFHYFGSKRGLYLAAMDNAARELADAHAAAGAAAPRDEVRAMLAAHFDFMVRRPTLAVALLRGGIGADPDAWAIFDIVRRQFLARVCGLLQLDAEASVLMFMLRALSGAIDESTLQMLEAPHVVAVEVLVDALLHMLAAAIEVAATLDRGLAVTRALALLEGNAKETR